LNLYFIAEQEYHIPV